MNYKTFIAIVGATRNRYAETASKYVKSMPTSSKRRGTDHFVKHEKIEVYKYNNYHVSLLKIEEKKTEGAKICDLKSTNLVDSNNFPQ